MKTLASILALVATLLASMGAADAQGAANLVYHERTTNDLTGGAVNTCGGAAPFVQVLNPAASQSYLLRCRIQNQADTDRLRIYYTTDGSNPAGALGVPSGTTQVVNGSYQCTFEFGGGTVDVGSGTIPAQPLGTVVKYIIGAWKDGVGAEVFANSGSCNSAGCATVFQYQVPRLSQLWVRLPGSHAALTNDTTQRVLDYNPITGHLLFASRAGSNGVHILDGLTGSTVGLLAAGTLLSGGSVLSFNAIGIADDGAIYGANVTDPNSSSFKLYRWDTETSVPVAVYGGNLSGAPTGRYGDMIAVRGSGAGTQILIGSDKGNVVLLTTSSPVGASASWTARNLPISGGTANFYRGGLSFAAGNSFYGKTSGNVLHLVNFDPVAGTASFARAILTPGSPSGFSGINFNPGNNWFAGVFRSATAGVAGTNFLWDASDTNSFVLLHQKSFPTSNADSSGQSCAAWGNGRLYTMVANNGIMAFNVPPQPAISTQPQTQTVAEGANVTLSVSMDAAAGAGPYTYQWQKNGIDLPGATASTLNFNPLSPPDDGAYRVSIANYFGSLSSFPAQLTVMPTNPPVIMQHPLSRSVFAGGTARFSVQGVPYPRLTYFWLSNDVALTSQTSSTLVLPGVNTDASFRAVIHNEAGYRTSIVATLTVITPASGTFAAAALADAPLSYLSLYRKGGQCWVRWHGWFS